MTLSTLSPNYNARPLKTAIDTLVLHYTGMESGAEALARLCDPEAKVSAHYLIEEDGKIFPLVPEGKRAWHAGISQWRGRDNLNDNSIGIELVNPGHEHGYRPFPAAQMEALAELCQGILSRHPIPARNVIGHSDIAPDRKEDPGELFDWAWLAQQGVGWFISEDLRELRLHPTPDISLNDAGPHVTVLQESLRNYGYFIDITGIYDDKTAQVVRAFQRHFRPTKLQDVWDAECDAILNWLHTFVERDSLIAEIYREFGGKQPPVNLSMHDPIVGYPDYEGSWAQVHLKGKRWEEKGTFDMLQGYGLAYAALCFMTAEGARYFMPAYMVMALQHAVNDPGNPLNQSALDYVSPFQIYNEKDRDMVEYCRQRLMGFSKTEFEVIQKYTRFVYESLYSNLIPGNVKDAAETYSYLEEIYRSLY